MFGRFITCIYKPQYIKENRLDYIIIIMVRQLHDSILYRKCGNDGKILDNLKIKKERK